MRRVLVRRSNRRREAAWQSALSDVAMRLSRDLRTGTSIDTALVEAVAIGDAPWRVKAIAAELRAGQLLGAILHRWAIDARTEPERLLVAALSIGFQAGAQLGPVLDGLAVALRDELALDARRRVLLVQAQVSAVVLVVLPIGFAALASVLRGGFVFDDGIGAVLLVVGLVLDGLGVFWMRRLMRGLR